MEETPIEKQIERAVTLVLAMMKSASTDKIKPVQWWERAKSALETGAAVASNLPELVSTMGRKLQIDAPTQATASSLSSLSDEIKDDFDGFRRVCEEQALYVVAIAQGRRADEREQYLARQRGEAPPWGAETAPPASSEQQIVDDGRVF